jgi:hypothetical protein
VKLKFIYKDDGYFDVVSGAELKALAGLLSDNTSPQNCEHLIEQATKARKEKEFKWAMSFNQTYMKIEDGAVFCENLYDDTRVNYIPLDEFINLIHAWKSFVKIKGRARSKTCQVNLEKKKT